MPTVYGLINPILFSDFIAYELFPSL